jgi:hypothetical protein
VRISANGGGRYLGHHSIHAQNTHRCRGSIGQGSQNKVPPPSAEPASKLMKWISAGDSALELRENGRGDPYQSMSRICVRTLGCHRTARRSSISAMLFRASRSKSCSTHPLPIAAHSDGSAGAISLIIWPHWPCSLRMILSASLT